MKHGIHDLVITQPTRSLKALKGILIKARDYAKDRKFDEANYLQLRLAPDMFSFLKQVQIATDMAKAAPFRLAGKPVPALPDEEKTFDDLISRVDRVVGYLKEFSENDFANYEKQTMSFPWNPGKHLEGQDYLPSHLIPNFYFHMAMTYAILRSAGVPLGKGDFLGEQNWKNS